MKNIILTILLLITTTFFSQDKDKKSLLEEMNNYYKKNKIEKLEQLTNDLLAGKYGVMDDELNFYALMYSSNVYSSDKYASKDAQKGYDKLFDLLYFVQKTSYAIPNKKVFIASKINYLMEYKRKHPEVKKSVKENENKAVAVNKTTQTNTTETNTTTKSTSDDKTVTLTVSGTGKSLEEARLNALRSAIEQAFGAFISAKTEILNDNLIKDEIVSIANGNVKKYDVVSEVQMPNGDFSTSLKATVSVTKLTSFVESKGVLVEFKGSLFAFNINQQILNEKNEIKAVNDLLITLKSIIEKSLDFSIQAETPKALDDTNQSWNVPLYLNILFNNNITSFKKYLIETLVGMSLTISEAENYKNLGKEVYEVNIDNNKIMLRKMESKQLILTDLFFHFVKFTLNTKISDNISSLPISSFNPNIFSSFNPIVLTTDSTNDYHMLKLRSIFDVTTYFKKRYRDFNYGKVPLTEVRSYSGGYYFSDIILLDFCEQCEFAKFKLNSRKTLDEINKITEYKISKE